MKRNLKNEIIELRKAGLSYNAIVKELGCSKSTICYHTNENSRVLAIKNNNIYPYRFLIKRIAQFCRRADPNYNSKTLFSYKDVIDKFGINTECYLTGKPINILTDKFDFDHIIPLAKGGDGSLSNLGITSPEANRFKSDMTIEDLVSMSKLIIDRFDKVSK